MPARIVRTGNPHRMTCTARERTPKVIGADAKAFAAERLGQAVHPSLSAINNHVHVGRRPRDAKGSHRESAHEKVIHPRCAARPLRRLSDGGEREPLLRHLGGSRSNQSCPPPCPECYPRISSGVGSPIGPESVRGTPPVGL